MLLCSFFYWDSYVFIIVWRNDVTYKCWQLAHKLLYFVNDKHVLTWQIFFLLLRVEYWFGLLLSESKDLVLKEWTAECFLTLLEFNKEVSFKPSFSLLVTYFLFRRKNVSWRDVLLNNISYTTFLHVLTYHPATLFNYLHTLLRKEEMLFSSSWLKFLLSIFFKLFWKKIKLYLCSYISIKFCVSQSFNILDS